MDGYDPFARGSHPVGVQTIEARDAARDRRFPVELWYPAEERHAGEDLSPETRDTFAVPRRPAPREQRAVRDAEAQPGTFPLVVYSHPSGSNRRAATFLTTHLASHGYIVAALDHSEIVAPELAAQEAESAEQRAARIEGLIASRVPDLRFLLDAVIARAASSAAVPDVERIGAVGHSFGGWTVLAALDEEPRIGAVVALAPAGGSQPRPGILPVTLAFAWQRDVPTLYVAAELDASIPPSGIVELLDRTPSAKRLVILHAADHLHFMDDVAYEHEAVRAMPFPPALAWLPRAMRPAAELLPEERAHLAVRGLTLAHLDATLKSSIAAQRWLRGDVVAKLAGRGIDAEVRTA